MLTELRAMISGMFNAFLREVMKFGVVGGLAFVIDSGMYALLLHGPLEEKTLTAKALASLVATLFAWVANRHWTFKDRLKASPVREFVMFFAMNAVGILIALFCVAVSHYVLGFESKTADFVAGNVVGLVLGTLFRFFAYRTWVFKEEMDAEEAEEAARRSVAPALTPTGRP